MKVCHFIASRGLGRGETYVDLINELCTTIEIVLLVPKGALFIPRVDNRIQIIEYGAKDSRRNPFLYLELYSQFKRIKPELVHTHFAKATEIFNRLNKILNMPWVSTKHNPRKGRIFNQVDQVIAVSKVVAESVSHDRVKIIHNGISPEVLPPVGEKNKLFTIIAVGRLEKVKAFDRLVTECSKLSFEFKLLLVGDGPEKSSLVDLVSSLDIDKKVDFLGYRSDIPELMRQSDVIVVCSQSEGFSMVILEGLFYGEILVSRNVGIASQLLPDMFLIKKYEIATKLEEVFRTPELFKAAFATLRKSQGTQYLIKRTADEHIGFYQSITSKSLNNKIS